MKRRITMEKQQIESKLREIVIKRVPALTLESIKDDATFGALGIDSLAMGWIMADIEETFNVVIRGGDVMKMKNMAGVVDFLAEKV